LQTGGDAFGEISTKSVSRDFAISKAFESGYTPTSTLSPTNLTSLAIISPLILWGFFLIILPGLLPLFLLSAIALGFNYMI